MKPHLTARKRIEDIKKGPLLCPFFKRVLVLRDHGRDARDKNFWNREVAFKYKMSSLQAALGLAQVERAEELIQKKRAIFHYYSHALKYLPIQLNPQHPDTQNAYWMSSLLLNAELNLDKETFQNALAAYQIDTRPIFYPLSSLPAYRQSPDAERARLENKVSYELSPRGINLPSALILSEKELNYVCEHIEKVLGDYV